MRRLIPVIVLAISAVAVADHIEMMNPASGSRTSYQSRAQAARTQYNATIAAANQQLLANLSACESDARAAGDMTEAARLATQVQSLQNAMGNFHPAGRLDHDHDADDLQILSAHWGVDDRWLDVTDYVRHHVRDGRLKFESIDYRELMPEPAPNVLKMLVVEVQPSPVPMRVIVHQVPNEPRPQPFEITMRR